MHTPLILAVSTLFATTLAVGAGPLAAAPAQDRVTSTSASDTEHYALVTGKKVNVRNRCA